MADGRGAVGGGVCRDEGDGGVLVWLLGRDGVARRAALPGGLSDYDRGWWSTGFEGQMLFYDPAEAGGGGAGGEGGVGAAAVRGAEGG